MNSESIHLLFRTQHMSVITRRFLSSFSQKTVTSPNSESEYVPNVKKSFIDSLRIYARGGAGGQGLPRYGGIGGDGGGVYVLAKKQESLINLYKSFPKRRFVAGNGGNSTKYCLLGSPGNDKIINVPVGVEVLTDDGEIIGDLNEEGEKVCIAQGGKGGNASNSFLGRRGDGRIICLNLKLIADVGLVGFPNAGKSTFLKAISRAKPKIASYPFTTIQPQIGIVEFPDFRKISVADLPGLIEGAHANFGMGHRFLKHVERTKLHLFMVDVGGFQLAQTYPHRSAFQTILLLIKELELYQEDMLLKPIVLVINKVDTDPESHLTSQLIQLINDLPGSLETVSEEMRPKTLVKFEEVITISAQNCSNTMAVMECVRSLLDKYAEEYKTFEHKDADLLQNETDGSVKGKHTEHARRKLV